MRRFLVLVLFIAAALPFVPATASAADGVCALACDALDPSQAKQETFPLPDLVTNGRTVRLHASDPDGMAWASIDGGSAGDSVWLDRSWDGGATWDGLLGKASIPSTWTGTRTLMYNLTDPVHHRRGLLRACGDAQDVACTDWIYPKVCDIACDGTDAGQANGDTQPVGPATIYGRTITLHTDNNSMAWASIDNSAAGDEVWLDRSWDAGASWPDGSSLGRTSIPSGTSTHTTMFATRDPRGKLYGGAVRACGREATHQYGACTPWVQPAPVKAKAAADALMYDYQPDTAWWLSSWWNSAASLTALATFETRTGTHDYDWAIAQTFNVNKGPFPAGVRSGDQIDGDFTSRAIDDTAWWGLAWIAAYDQTKAASYLDEATTIANYVNGFWDTGTCGGGIWWDRERTYKNAVTSGLYLRLTAALHNRIGGDTVWGQRAQTAGDWYLGSGLINSTGLVNDGLTGDCHNNGQTVWSYNQGVAIGGFTELYRATNDTKYLDEAKHLADSALTAPELTTGGILTESCDTGTNSCDDNQKQFKGVFARYLGDLAQHDALPISQILQKVS